MPSPTRATSLSVPPLDWAEGRGSLGPPQEQGSARTYSGVASAHGFRGQVPSRVTSAPLPKIGSGAVSRHRSGFRLSKALELPSCAVLRGYCNGCTTLCSKGVDPMLVLSLIGFPPCLVE